MRPDSPAARMARFRKRRDVGYPVVVSEGDSWFSYEFFRNIIDIIEREATFAHFRAEQSADTLARMTKAHNLEDILYSIKREKALFLLFSGGGNDLQQSAPKLFQSGNTITECIVSAESDELFSAMDANYRALVDHIGPHVPVVAHGYDYFKPRPEGVKFFDFPTPIGPWVHPAMIAKEITNPDLQMEITTTLINRFNIILAALQEEYPDWFIHIDLRNTLNPEQDWENEIHPTRQGFERVAREVLTAIHSKVASLVVKRNDVAILKNE